MAAAAAEESSPGWFFKDWYSPLGLIGSLSGSEDDGNAKKQQQQDGEAMTSKELLRSQALNTLLDGRNSGRLVMALAEVEDMKNTAEADKIVQQVGECGTIEESHAIPDMESNRPCLAGVHGAPISHASEKEECPHRPSSGYARCGSVKTGTKETETSTAIKSRPLDTSEVDQLALQAKIAALEVITFGSVQAKVMSPTKGKKAPSPKKGGS